MTKKDYPIVKGKWIDIIEPEYELLVTCPHCKTRLDSLDIRKKYAKDKYIYECDTINCIVEWIYCKNLFKLKVKGE